MLKVSKHIRIDEQELEETFIHASGPGGQKVNKTATAVQLRFDVLNSTSLPEEVRERLGKLAGSRLTQDGVLVIEAKEHRTQERNRDAARQRLVDLIRARPASRKRARRPNRRRRLRSAVWSKNAAAGSSNASAGQSRLLEPVDLDIYPCPLSPIFLFPLYKYFNPEPVLKSTTRSTGSIQPCSTSSTKPANVAAPSGAAKMPSSRPQFFLSVSNSPRRLLPLLCPGSLSTFSRSIDPRSFWVPADLKRWFGRLSRSRMIRRRR